MNDRSEFDIDIRHLVNLVLERFWLLTLCVSIFVLGALSYIAIAPRLYESTVLVEVPMRAQRVVKIMDVSSQDYSSLEVIKTIELNLQRESLYQRVMQREDVSGLPKLLKGQSGEYGDYQPQQLAQMLADWTDVRLRRGTRLIEITVEHRVPGVAQKLANTIVAEYIREMIGSRTGSSKTAFTFLMEEAERVRTKLQASEDDLQDFKKAVELSQKIEKQEDDIDRLTQRYRDKHPSLVQARSMLEQLTTQFQSELNKVLAQLRNKPLWQEQEAKLAELSGQERMDAELKMIEAHFNVRSRELQTDRILYDSIVTRMKETDVTKGIESNPVDIVEQAQSATNPSKPRKLLILVICSFMGVGTGLGLIVLINLFDNTIKTVDEAEDVIGLPVLGAIPDDNRIPDVEWMKQGGQRLLDKLKAESAAKMDEGASTGMKKPKAKKSGKIEPLVLLSDSGGQAAEALRSLRASIKLLGREEERKTFLLTSAVPGEGKSFVASNLALSFAQEGRKTLLIDADLRRPMVDKIFAISEKDNLSGIVGYLAGQSDLAGSLYDPQIENLMLMPVGKMAPNPAELLASSMFETLLNEVSQIFDRVVIDSAPVNSVSDSLIIAPQVQSAVIVAHAAKTPRGAVLRAKEQLTKAHKIPVGMVLNRLPSRSGLVSDPYYYYYSAGDGYGKAYGG